jgi:hypothetical protein
MIGVVRDALSAGCTARRRTAIGGGASAQLKTSTHLRRQVDLGPGRIPARALRAASGAGMTAWDARAASAILGLGPRIHLSAGFGAR